MMCDASREALRQARDALEDYKGGLDIEPWNKEAQAKVAQLTQSVLNTAG